MGNNLIHQQDRWCPTVQRDEPRVGQHNAEQQRLLFPRRANGRGLAFCYMRHLDIGPMRPDQGAALEATRGTKQLKLDPSIYESIQKEKVTVGDVIYIEANSGAVKRVGRSDAYATEYDLEAEEYVPIPKGDVHKKKEIVQDVTLHDLDTANAKPQGGQSGQRRTCSTRGT